MVELRRGASDVKQVSVVLPHAVDIPPLSEIEVMGAVPQLKETESSTWLLEDGRQGRGATLVARAVVNPQHGTVPVRLLNTRDEQVSIQKNRKVATIELLPEEPEETMAGLAEAKSEMSNKRDTLHKIVEGLSNLEQQQKRQLYDLLIEYDDVFAGGPDDFGKIKHEMSTGNPAPIRQQVRRVPPAKRQILLKGMLEKKVIQPSSSPWASPIVLVKKKDGSTRICVDYRKVNDITRKDAYPLPRIDDTLDTLAGARWFTTLNQISGYWQVEMSEKDKEKTAFCTPSGLFEFNVMPFGLCNAPAHLNASWSLY